MTLETGIGSPNNPLTSLNANHLAALAKEKKMLGLNVPPPDPAGDLRVLLTLLGDAKAVAKRISDLTTATSRHDQSAAAARRDAEAARHAEANLAARKQAVEDEIDRQRADHNAVVARERAELESEKQAVAKLRTRIEADLAAASKAKAEQERRLRAMEGAAA